MQEDLPEPFDDSLSNDISLSKILDAFITEGESSSIIVSFLDSHDSAFKSIIAHSLHWTRLFQLDFVLHCGEHEVAYLLKKLKSIPGSVAAYCCWQICKSESGASNRLKYTFKREMDWILSTFKTRHPYSSISAKSIAQVDLKLFSACARDEFCSAVCALSDEEFMSLLTTSRCSIFKLRLFSLDVFLELDPLRQWMFLKKSDFFQSKFTEIFLWQLLASEVSDDIKKAAIDCFCEYGRCNKEGSVYASYITSSAYSEMMLKMTLDGKFDTQALVKQLLCNEKWKLLNEWAEKDSETLDQAFKISSIVKEKWAELKSAKNSLRRT